MATQNTKTPAEDFQALKDDVKKLQSDMVDLLKVLKQNGGEKLAELRERAGEHIHDKADAVKDTAQAVRDTTRQAAEEHPFGTAVVALCLGLVTGALLRGVQK